MNDQVRNESIFPFLKFIVKYSRDIWNEIFENSHWKYVWRFWRWLKIQPRLTIGRPPTSTAQWIIKSNQRRKSARKMANNVWTSSRDQWEKQMKPMISFDCSLNVASFIADTWIEETVQMSRHQQFAWTSIHAWILDTWSLELIGWPWSQLYTALLLLLPGGSILTNHQSNNQIINTSFPFPLTFQLSQVERLVRVILFSTWPEHFSYSVEYPRTVNETYQRENECKITIDIDPIDVHDAPRCKQHVESIDDRQLRISFSASTTRARLIAKQANGISPKCSKIVLEPNTENLVL